jgi:hypothetical protein
MAVIVTADVPGMTEEMYEGIVGGAVGDAALVGRLHRPRRRPVRRRTAHHRGVGVTRGLRPLVRDLGQAKCAAGPGPQDRARRRPHAPHPRLMQTHIQRRRSRRAGGTRAWPVHRR